MNTLRLIFIHGISPNVINWNYSLSLSNLLVAKLMEYGVIPEGASPEEVAQVITFEQVNYSMIGDDAQERLLAAYEREAEKLYGFTARLNRMAGLHKVRKQIITSVSDVMVYKSEYWRKEIHELVVDRIDPYLETGDAVTIIAHSLGSVVAFDALYDNIRNNPKWLAANFKPANFFTMGSPLALFTLDMDRTIGSRNPPPDGPVIPHSELVVDEGVWYNFLDAQDVIAYPLEAVFEDRFNVQDVVVQTGTNPNKAHNGYWDNDEITDFMGVRLKLDFQRINSGEALATATSNNAQDVALPTAQGAPDVEELPLLARLLDS